MSATGALYSAMGISALSSLGTGYAQSQSLKATGRYQKGLADTNAAMVDMAGEQTLQAGDIAAGRKNLQTKARVGEELAQQGASGVSVGSGSNALVRGGTNLVGNIDELTIRNNAAREAFGYKVQGIQGRFQGQFAQLTAQAEAKQSLLSGGLGAVAGPLKIYSDYKRLQSMILKGGSSGKIPNSYVDVAGDIT